MSHEACRNPLRAACALKSGLCRRKRPLRACLRACVLSRRGAIRLCCGAAQEVVGTAIAILLLSHGAVPLWAGVIITAISSFMLRE